MNSLADADIFRRSLSWAIQFLLTLLVIVILVQMAGLANPNYDLSWFFFVRQDIAELALMLAMLVALRGFAKETYLSKAAFALPHGKSAAPWLCVAALLLICWAGHYLIFHGYDLTRDERLVRFDAYILAHGRLFWPIPEQWRHLAPALNQMFMLPIGDHEGWVSNYLPMNAALHALFGFLGPAALTSPALVAIGALALWNVAARLWPNARQSGVIALLLYAGSSQIMFTGMTSYAMTAHLALNLIWLALFLKDTRLSHAGAIIVGFVATGLHQPIFHPMFVAPFLLMLLWQKRWRLLASYCTAYGAIGAFWLGWPLWISSFGLAAIPENANTGVSFLARAADVMHIPGINAFWLMAINLLRFVSWQHLLLLPLLGAGLHYAWRSGDGIARALALGVLLPLPVALIILPYQGHGWGYRYLHGVLGNVCLLGVYGWHVLKDRGLRLDRLLLHSSIVTAVILIPLHGWQVYQMTKPFAEIDRAIGRSGAQLAIIDDGAAPFARDLVFNRPDLSNRPIRLLGSALTQSDIERLCAHGAMTFGAARLEPINGYFHSYSGKRKPDELARVRALRQCKQAPVGARK